MINARIICSDKNAKSASEMFYKMIDKDKLYELNLIDETSGMQQYLGGLRDQTVSCSIIAIFMIFLSVVMFCFQVYYNIRKIEKVRCVYDQRNNIKAIVHIDVSKRFDYLYSFRCFVIYT